MTHGGKRPGAGRPRGSRSKLSGQTLVAIRTLAQEHGPEALKTVARLMRGDNASVALAAARELLDRAYGRSVQQTELTGKDGRPVEISKTLASSRLNHILESIASSPDDLKGTDE